MREYQRLLDRIDFLYAQAKKIGIEDRFLLAQISNYLCILVSGFLERAIEDITISYCAKRSEPSVTHYVSRQIARFQNPSAGKIEELGRAFGPTISERLEKLLDDKIRASIDSVVSNRNNLAHGRSATVTLSMLLNWDADIRDFVERLQTEVFV